MAHDEGLTQQFRQAVAGDKQAYKAVLKAIMPLIKAYLAKRLRDQNAIEDLCQEILIKIHGARHTFDTSAKFEPWLYTITKRTLIDHVRKTKRRGDQLTDPALMQEMEGASGPAEAQLAFQAAFDSLNDQQKEALRLMKVEGLSAEEAAKEAGVSPSAIKVRAHRAFKTFTAALGGAAADEPVKTSEKSPKQKQRGQRSQE